MRDLTKRCLSLLLAAAVVSTMTYGAVRYRSPMSPVRDAQAIGNCHGEDSLVLALTNTAGLTDSKYGCNLLADSTAKQLNDTDAHETKVSLYEKGASQRQNNELWMDSMNNYLEDTQSIATMEGKNAFIRALENGSSKATARSQARQAVADYYATKQRQLLNSWDLSLTNWQSYRAIAANTTNVSASFVSFIDVAKGSSVSTTNTAGSLRNHTLTLVNDDTKSVLAFTIDVDYGGPTVKEVTDPVNTKAVGRPMPDSYYVLESPTVKAPDSNYNGPTRIFNRSEYHQKWTEIQQQNTAVQNRVDNFTSVAYDQWSSGEIDSSDLVDPYLGARDYSPKDNPQTWTIMSLQSMGVNAPANMSGYKHMTINLTDQGRTVRGILMSDGIPPSGQFTVGQTYNASNLTGKQFVVTNDSQVAIDGRFSIEQTYDTDGNPTNQSAVKYRDINYTTTNLTAYKNLLNRLQKTQAEIEARQQRLRAETASGGGLDFGGLQGQLPFGGAGALAALGAIVVLGLVARN